jgi:hypothetical protein
MARGQPTADDDVLRFRREYLRLGNARRAARNVGLPETTGQDLAKRDEQDETFVQLRAELYTREMAEVETLAADVARTSHRRFSKSWEASTTDEGIPLVTKDPRPDYGRLVMDALRSMSSHRARLVSGGSSDDRPDEIVFRRYVASEPDPEEGPAEPGDE